MNSAVSFGASANVLLLRSAWSSASVPAFTLTLPSFFTVTVYVIVAPTATFSVGLAFFVMLSFAAAASAVTVAVSDAVTSLPLGSFPVALAVLSIFPASTSA